MIELFIGTVIAGVAIYFTTTLGLTIIQIMSVLGLYSLLCIGLDTMIFGLQNIINKLIKDTQEKQTNPYTGYNPNNDPGQVIKFVPQS